MTQLTFYIHTFGCQMNVNDSDWLERVLLARGFCPAEKGQEAQANVIILNTCSVRDKPEQKVYSFLGRIRRQTRGKADPLICIGGCVAQQIGRGFFSRFKQVRLVFGTDGLIDAPDAIAELLAKPNKRMCLVDFAKSFPERDACWQDKAVPAAAYVNIMQGCNNFCAYCIVPFTRGRQKSRTREAVLTECKTLLDQGAKDITLLGQNVNSFGLDKYGDGTSFSQLLRDVAALDGLQRLHMVTPHPKDIADEVIQAFADLPVLCPRLHLPLQSGSDRILHRMGRRYDAARYMNIVERLKQARPDILISSDIIVGFPGETEEDFADTMKIMAEVPFVQSFSFIYSDRPGTKASVMPDKLTREEATERLTRLQALQTAQTEAQMLSYMDTTAEVLFDEAVVSGANVEGSTAGEVADSIIVTRPDAVATHWQGRDQYGWPVSVHLEKPAALYGSILPVKITKARMHSLEGVLVDTVGGTCR